MCGMCGQDFASENEMDKHLKVCLKRDNPDDWVVKAPRKAHCLPNEEEFYLHCSSSDVLRKTSLTLIDLVGTIDELEGIVNFLRDKVKICEPKT